MLVVTDVWSMMLPKESSYLMVNDTVNEDVEMNKLTPGTARESISFPCVLVHLIQYEASVVILFAVNLT